MKKILLTLAATAAFSTGAFAQGYMVFASQTVQLLDDFTTPGTPTADGNLDVAFIWNAGSGDTLSGLGSGNPWTTFTSLSGGWEFGVNNATGNTEITPTFGTGPAPTHGTFNGGTIAITGTSASEAVTLYVIAWNNQYSTISAAAAANAAVGWSAPINYTFGSSSSPGLGMGSAGLTQFTANPVPEPTTLALAGIGGLSMLFLRRRKA